MDADPSLLVRKAGMLPLGYQKIKRSIHRWISILLNFAAPQVTLNWRILDACRSVEKLMTTEAIYISKLKPGLNNGDKNRGGNSH